MSDTGREPTPIGDSLDVTLRSLKGPSRAVASGVFGRWEELVGPTVAAHVRPVRLDRGVLTVSVDDPVWSTHVQFLTDDLIRRIEADTATVVNRVDVRVDRPRRR